MAHSLDLEFLLHNSNQEDATLIRQLTAAFNEAGIKALDFSGEPSVKITYSDKNVCKLLILQAGQTEATMKFSDRCYTEVWFKSGSRRSASYINGRNDGKCGDTPESSLKKNAVAHFLPECGKTLIAREFGF